MQLASPDQRRFLLRSSALLIVFLSAWWFLLARPALIALHGAVSVPFAFMSKASATIEPAGEWTFRVPVDDLPDDALRRMGAKRIESVDFTVPGRDLLVFTLGLPAYLALGLSAPGPRRLRPLLWGCALEALIGVICVVVFAQVTAYNSLAQMRPGTGAMERWFLDLAWYLVTGVVPYVAPLVAAVSLHEGLRRRIFVSPVTS